MATCEKYLTSSDTPKPLSKDCTTLKTWQYYLQIPLKILFDNLILSLWILGIALVSIAIAIWDSYNTQLVDLLTERTTIMWWTKQACKPNDGVYVLGDKIHCNIICRQNIPLSRVDAFLFSGSYIQFNDLPLPRRPQEVIWALFHDESPLGVLELTQEKVLNLFNYSSTFSRYSDEPITNHLFNLEDITSQKYFVKTADKNTLLSEIAPVLYLQSNCATLTERDTYVTKLMKYTKIDSYGFCLNNKKTSNYSEIHGKKYLNKLYSERFLTFASKYKFVIAIENSICHDYMSEKLWRAIEVGSVPIYFGSPSVRDWLPNKKSAILIEDFPTPKLLSTHIKTLNENDDLYEQYLEHKIHKRITNQNLINNLKDIEASRQENSVIEPIERLVCTEIHRLKSSSKVNIVTKRHLDCPEPISVLDMQVNPNNSWLRLWRLAEENSQLIHKIVMENYTDYEHVEVKRFI